MRPGVRLGVDVGTVRVGLAASDAAGVLATPVETVRRGGGDLDRIAEVAADRGAVEVVVGLPRSLSGAEGAAAGAAGKETANGHHFLDRAGSPGPGAGMSRVSPRTQRLA